MTSRLPYALALVLALPAIAVAQEEGAGGLGDPAPAEAPPRAADQSPAAEPTTRPAEQLPAETTARPDEQPPAPAETPAATPDSGAGLADALGDPRVGATPRPAAARADRAPRAAPVAPAEAAPWDGPRVELGYTHYAIVDGFGGGDVHAGFFGGYLPTSSLRLGGSAELGVRDYSLGQSDALLRASVVAGYQHLSTRPFVPYVVAVGTAGILLTKRFRTPGSDAIFGAGLEVGADLNLYRTLYVGVGLAYQRASVGGLGHDLWVIRLRIGL